MNKFLFTLLFQNSESPVFLMVCVLAIFMGMIMLGLTAAMRIVPEYARMAVFRLGRFVGVRGPGILLLLPFVDRGVQVDLREKKETINAEVSTQDNRRINIQMNLGYRIIEPDKSILNVPDLTAAVRDTARNQLKSILGSLAYGEVIHDRAGIETALKTRLGEAMKLWGCEVTSAEILEIQRS